MGRLTRFECIFCYTALHTTKNQYYQYYLIYSVSSAPHINLQELTLDTHFFFFFETGSESTDLHSSLKSSSSKSRLFAFTILGFCPAVWRSKDSLCTCGGMYWCQVSYHVMSWRGEYRGREVEWVQLEGECGEMHEHQLLHWPQAGRHDGGNWTQLPSRSTVSHLFYNRYPYTIPFSATLIKTGSKSTLTRFLNFQLKL